jgi:hypothetical protein
VKDSLRLIPAATVCRCAGCEGLGKRYGSDPDLLAFYRKRLLQRGWAGATDDIEKAYQVAHAPWAKAAQESGARLAQSFPGRTPKHLQRVRVAVDGEASGAKVTPQASPGADGEPEQAVQAQLVLPMVEVGG